MPPTSTRLEACSYSVFLQWLGHRTFAVMQEQYMQRALGLAQRGKGYTTPNPMVGAVLVHEGRVIGEGWHERYGEAHAEVNCLAHVADEDRPLIPQSTMYVTLEPCAHWGKTPPCANRLVQEGVKEVVIANIDPFEKVSGNGISILKEAGIPVTAGVMAVEGKWVNRRFFCFHEQQRPYIILKWAESAEGFMAPADRSRKQLSNAFSNQLVHQWRTEESAIIVGYQTALNDNPQLTARHYPGPQPLRIALDRKLQLPGSHQLFNGDAQTWILNEQVEEVRGNVALIQMDFEASVIPALLQKLYQNNKLSLIVEGGPVLLQSFIDAGLWDEARVFKTQVSIKEGIGSPKLMNAALSSKTPVANDVLELWVNCQSVYPYVEGVKL